MASLVLGAVGGYFFGPIGYAAGSYLGAALFEQKSETKYNVGPQLSDLKYISADYGQPIPWGRGTVYCAGQVWWNSDLQPRQSVAYEGGGGGKGGGGGGQTVTITTTYDMDVWFGLLDNGLQTPVGISRVWMDGALVYTADADASTADLAASSSSPYWDRLTFYDGGPSQLPDPTYEAAVGAANAVALRGRASVFIQGWKLGQSGSVRNLTFEVVVDGTAAGATIGAVLEGTSATDAYGFSPGTSPKSLAGLPLLGQIWATHYTGGADYLLEWIDLASANTIMSVHTDLIIPSAFIGIAAVDFQNSALIISGTKIYRFHSYTGELQYVECVITPNMIVVDLDNDIWAITAGSQVQHISIFDWDDPVTAQTPVVGVGMNHFLRNATHIPGRVYGVLIGGNIGYVDITTYTFVDLGIPSHASQYTPAFVGADQRIYDHKNSTSEILQYNYDGGLLDTLVVPVLGASLEIQLLDSNNMLWVRGSDALDPFVLIDTTTMTVDSTVIANGFEIAVAELDTGQPAFYGANSSYGAYGKLGILEGIGRITASAPTVASVQNEICRRSGLSSLQINTTGLSSISKPVRSFTWVQGSGRSASEQLMSTHFYEVVTSDKVTFIPRGGSSAQSLAYTDLGASTSEEDIEPLALTEANDLEMPAKLGLTYLNTENDYQADTQYSDRLTTATSETVEMATLAMGMTPSEAKAVVDTWAMDRVAGRFNTTIALLGDKSALQPTDVVTATGPDGSQFRLRLVELTDSYPVLGFKAVLDDSSVLTSQGITTADYDSSTTISSVVTTLMRLLDIPILQDSDDDAGLYVSAKGNASPYPGSFIFSSPDDAAFTFETSIDSSGTFGMCNTALGNWTGPRVFDEGNSVTVNVGDTLTSSTRAAMLANLSVNLMLIGSEIIQFRTASLVSTGVYTLTGLLRGCRGTQWAMTGHAVGERAQLLQTAGMSRIEMDNAEIGVERFFKGVTKGRAESTASSQNFTHQAIGLKPFAPYHPMIERDTSNNATLSWIRKTRLKTRVVGTAGINSPLGEEAELYDVEIYSSSAYTTLLRTFSELKTPEAQYTAAEQTADGVTPGNPIYAKVFQRSGTVGRGYALAMAA